jgi:hypothetical protein
MIFQKIKLFSRYYILKFSKIIFFCNRTRNEYFAYLKQAAKSFNILEIVLPRQQFFSRYVKG